MKKASRTFLTIAVALVALFSLTAKTLNVSAYTYKKGADVTIDKIVTNNAYIAASIFKDSITLLTLNDNGVKSILSNSDDCHVPMPNTIIRAKDGNSPRLSCYDFLVGKGDEWSGIMDFPTFEKDVTTYAQYAEYLEGFGYTKLKDEGWTKKCVFAQIEDASKSGSGPDTNKENTSVKICADVHGSSDRMKDVTQVSDSDKSTIEDYYLDIEPRVYPSDDYNFRLSKHGNTIFNFYTKATAAGNPDLTWTEFIKKWEDGAKSVNSVQVTIKQSDESDSNASSTDTVDHNTVYEKGSDARIVDKILGTVTNLPLSTAEVYNIYNQYLNDQDNVNLKCSDTYDFKSDTNNKWYKVQIKRDGKIVDNCWAAEARPYSPIKYTGASKTPSSYDPITGQDSSANTYYFTRENMTLEEIINQINKFDLTAIEGDINDISNPSASSNDPSANKPSESNSCYNAGIEAMSWIICPALNNTSNTVDGIEGYLRDWLQIKTVGEGGIFENSNGTHLYDGWSIFRNLANGLLIIVLLIIIFSQLTGYGIDNYGIKKMLPKLILMGILINLSFLFCQLAVDISNILGVGLDNMMKAIAANMNGGTAPNYTTSTIVTAVLGAIAGAGTVAGVAAGAIGGGGVMIAIVLLLALLVALIAVLMFFVMLSARIIIVAVFIVISPVAFALYILPNTQNLFKKWWKIFETALVIYPICGALYGASYIIKAIVGGDSGGFIPGIIAVVAPFLPFLALPTLLRGAMAGLGALGGTLTMLGNGLRKGAQSGSGAIQSGIKNSERYKYNADRIAENRRFRWAERNRNSSNLATRRKAQTLLNERTQQRAQDAVGVIPVDQALAQQRATSQRRSQEIKNYTDQYSTLTRSAMDTELQSAAAAYKADRNEQNSIRLQAAIAAADGRGMNRELLGALGQGGAGMLNLSGNDNNDQAILNQLASSGNKVLNQFAKTRSKNAATSMSLHDFVNGANAGDNLADVFNSKGAEIMNGMDDDTLSYISRSGSGAGINTETILNAAMQTSDAKELAQLNNMLRNRTGYNIKTSDFTKIKFDTYSALNPSVYANAVAELRNGSESSQRIISQMDQRVRADLGL